MLKVSWKALVAVASLPLVLGATCQNQACLPIPPCIPGDDRKPGCIRNVPNIPESGFDYLTGLLVDQPTVVFVPGIAGAIICRDLIAGMDIDAAMETRARATFRSPQTAITQAWDWTHDFDNDIDYCKLGGLPTNFEDRLENRLFEHWATQCVAKRLAAQIALWRAQPCNEQKQLVLVCASGGAGIAVQAAEAKFAGCPILPDKSIDRVIFVSAALPTDRSLKELARVTRDGIYNYYSSADATLLGIVCPSSRPTFEFPWPAAGRFGYREDSPNLAYVRAQLGWMPEHEDSDNTGSHMSAYQSKFFKSMLQAAVFGNTLPDGWRARVANEYVDPTGPATGEDFSLGIPELPRDPQNSLVIIVPGHESDSTFRASNLEAAFADEGVPAIVWDWTRLGDLASASDDERLRNIGRAATTFAGAVQQWKGSHPETIVHLVTLSSGAMLASLACDLAGDTKLENDTFENVLLSSARLPTERSLDGLWRCTGGKVFVYYSMKNLNLVANRSFPMVDCNCSRGVNSSDNINNVNGCIESSIAWPTVGRFGYRNLAFVREPNRLWQLGWIDQYEDDGNYGAHLDETSGSFAKEYFVPLFNNGVQPADWQHRVREEYQNVADAIEENEAEKVCKAIASLEPFLEELLGPILSCD